MRLLPVLVLAACSAAAQANPHIAALGVKPNPVAFAGDKTPPAVISVTIDRPTPLDQSCEATVDPGDGTKPALLSWSMGDGKTKSFKHEYRRAGTYKVSVKGSGKDPCAGSRTAEVTVSAAAVAAKVECPKGWTVDPDSMRGSRYTCHATPPATPIRCPQGTKYFAEAGRIGCR